ncbi:MAG TPA: hypothetical protein VE915_07145 [Actinomycetota bacterium]|nr:hypothetical protein [Actinomycetota bacterium]
MYVISLFFLLASVVSLLVGLRRGGLTLVFVSIGCSVLAGLFLAASVLRKRSDGLAEERNPERGVDEWRGAPTGPGSSDIREEPFAAEARAGPLATQPLVGIVDRPLAGRHAPEPEISTGIAPDAVSSGGVLGPDVVVSSDRRTYHVPGCEHARGRASSNSMKRAVAKRLGYTPCGVCRPG